MFKKLAIFMVVLMMVIAVPAVAVEREKVEGNKNANFLVGTSADTTFYAKAGNDSINDTAEGDQDVVYAGRGSDTIFVNDSKQGNDRDGDFVNCGKGNDTVYYDPKFDEVASNCENTFPA